MNCHHGPILAPIWGPAGGYNSGLGYSGCIPETQNRNQNLGKLCVALVCTKSDAVGERHLSMKPIVRVPLVLLLTAVAIGLGVVGVHASTKCVRFIRKKVRHHKVSAGTAARWAAWDKAHPNWHPKKSPAETMAQLDFACAVPIIQKPVDGELPPLELNTFSFPPDLELPPPDAPPVVAMNEPPQDLFPDQPPMSRVSPPIFTPRYPTLFGAPPSPPPPGHTVNPTGGGGGLAPEPSSWMLLATSLLAMGTLASRRPRTAKVIARRSY